jgi:hypothetical protein
MSELPNAMKLFEENPGTRVSDFFSHFNNAWKEKGMQGRLDPKPIVDFYNRTEFFNTKSEGMASVSQDAKGNIIYGRTKRVNGKDTFVQTPLAEGVPQWVLEKADNDPQFAMGLSKTFKENKLDGLAEIMDGKASRALEKGNKDTSLLIAETNRRFDHSKKLLDDSVGPIEPNTGYHAKNPFKFDADTSKAEAWETQFHLEPTAKIEDARQTMVAKVISDRHVPTQKEVDEALKEPHFKGTKEELEYYEKFVQIGKTKGLQGSQLLGWAQAETKLATNDKAREANMRERRRELRRPVSVRPGAAPAEAPAGPGAEVSGNMPAAPSPVPLDTAAYQRQVQTWGSNPMQPMPRPAVDPELERRRQEFLRRQMMRGMGYY